jgi:hypothetical protein
MNILDSQNELGKKEAKHSKVQLKFWVNKRLQLTCVSVAFADKIVLFFYFIFKVQF